MINIKFIRVDERLIHGQVLNKWLEVINCNRIWIIDDDVYEEPITRKVLKMSLPEEVSLNFYNVEKGIEALKSDVFNEEVIILFKNLIALYKVIEANIRINEVNIARLPYRKGKSEILKNIYISKDEKVLIQELINKKVKLIVQMVPDSIPINLSEIVKGGTSGKL